MLNRKENKLANGRGNGLREKKTVLPTKSAPARRQRFVLSARSKARAESERNGKLLDGAPVSIFLKPTDYSLIK